MGQGNLLFNLHTEVCNADTDTPCNCSDQIHLVSIFPGSDDLNSRWLAERAVKEAGYPEHIVRSVLFPTTVSGAVTPSAMDWATLLAKLGQKLVGNDPVEQAFESDFDVEERDIQRAAEFSALESVYPFATLVSETLQAPNSSTVTPGNVTYLNTPIPNSPLTLHMVLPAWHPYPLSAISPPMYISSDSTPPSNSAYPKSAIPPYIRLHILSSILGSPVINNRDNGEGIGLVAAGIIEEEWEKVQTQGPPEVADVLRHLLRAPTTPSNSPRDPGNSTDQGRAPISDRVAQRRGAVRSVRLGDDRSDAQILVDFDTVKMKEQYQSLLKDRVKLPAWKVRSDFLQAFKTNSVVVCVGETGSGKTTQVPQYILDEYLGTSQSPDAPCLAQLQIIVTQPRRVAAISVASRVAAERGDDGSVAYTIRGESTATQRTKLLFCTTGVVLRRLTVGDGLDGVRVVVVDEVCILNYDLPYSSLKGQQVHERSVDSDFLLLELRELLKKNKHLKVVLMSATINQQTFVDYFGGAALVAIPGRTHPVQDSYVESGIVWFLMVIGSLPRPVT